MRKRQNYIGDYFSVATRSSIQLADLVNFHVEAAYKEWKQGKGVALTVINSESTKGFTFIPRENWDYEYYLLESNGQFCTSDFESMLHIAFLESRREKVLSCWAVGKGYAYQGTSAKLGGPMKWIEISYDAAMPVRNSRLNISLEDFVKYYADEENWAEVPKGMLNNEDISEQAF